MGQRSHTVYATRSRQLYYCGLMLVLSIVVVNTDERRTFYITIHNRVHIQMATILTFPYSLTGLIVALMIVTVGHEIGHLLAARALNVPVKLIALGVGPTLWRRRSAGIRFELRALPLGMSIGVLGRRDDDGRPRRPVEHDIGVAAGGPLASVALLLLFGGIALLAGSTPQFQSWLVMTASLSVILAGLNLIPLPGLDGGHLLLLTASRFGLQLSPQQEATVHQLGLQIAAAICVLLFVASVAGIV